MTSVRHPPLPSVDPLPGRGERWLMRMEGRPVPRFDDMARRPAWDRLDADGRSRATVAAALLHHRPALDREISGARLTRLAETVGETLIDTVLAIEIPEGWTPSAEPLPDTHTLHLAGAALVARPDAGALRDAAARLVLTA